MTEKFVPLPQLRNVMAFSPPTNDFERRDRNRLERKFFRRVREFPPEAQEFIADLSSDLLEADIHNEYRQGPEKMKQIASDLQSVGLNAADTKLVMRFFNLPYVSETDTTKSRS